ncbi:MAG TPA: C4-type zinc ribbon domain-containing protein [Syntrophales bacterium]|nr:C4-type zinc ribbon domain-containing protein [Syntrophales bacterium]HON22141.1 C4-type zinc ribbon domain-containing protein [Syntrophales bacterium]HPC31559.1 C4-type zinc ribbon domain-containing protein [Syntrophales bacterium]HQG34299.1 C4-type zinc ribbon domain-containing protein [Syntrophales bacterium]HQI34862.1 C4-type zinc ribbon domain-containing protein [Syntrophales bacterium]
MNENLVHLIALQKVDTEMQRILLSRKELPLRLAKLDADFAAVQAGLEEEKKRLEEKNRTHRELEDALKKGMEQLRKTRDRIHDVKSNKEYQAVLKEIETLEQKHGAVEDRIITVLEEIDAMKTSLTAREGEFDAARRKYDEEREKIAGHLGSVESRLREVNLQGEALRGKIPKQLLKKYDMTKNVNNGLAVVSAWKETCEGCHMNIPPQLYNELREETEELIVCPNCRRIIYWYDQSKENV